MEKLTANDPETRSADLIAANIERLKELFPELVTEGPEGAAINVDVLKALVGDNTVTDADEKFGLNWHGKRRARQLALTPSTGTLRPCPEESVDWDTTQNLMIEGDNLEVLKLLQKSYAGKVKMIYIDPPYNTGKDLLYPNDYQDGIRAYLQFTGQAEGGQTLTSNPQAGGRYHTNWLNMMYPPLKLARNLLCRDGVLVCTIDEHELTNLGCLLHDVFDDGTYDHVAVTIVHNPRGVQGRNFSYTHEYAYFVFPQDADVICARRLAPEDVVWSNLRNWGGESRRTDARNCFYPVIVRDDRIIGFGDVCADDYHPPQAVVDGELAYVYPIDREGTERKWRYARQSVEAVAQLLRVEKADDRYEIEIGKDFGTYRTVWSDKRYDANEYGTKILKELVPDSPFDFPKSLWNVYDCIQAVTGRVRDAIVLDFFAGSGTTGHAVWEINKADGGGRRVMLVQLPERLDGAGPYETIADITKTRLRAASRAITENDPMFAGDTGFRVFKLASSNIQAWDPDRENLAGTLEASVEHLKTDRTEQDILFELLLKLGLDLAVPIEEKSIAGKTVHGVGRGVLIACLATSISSDEVEPLALGIVEWHKEFAPAGETTVVFRDSAFPDDVAKTNVTAILQQHGLENVRSL